MKKQIIIIAGLVSVIMTPPASAVTKCVALNSSTDCSTGGSGGSIDWYATCTTNGKTISIEGIAACSDTQGTYGSVAKTLNLSSTVNDNEYCWCKMTSPVVSSHWVFQESNSGASDCVQRCSTVCGLYFNATKYLNYLSD